MPPDNVTTPLYNSAPTRPLDVDPDYLAGVLSARRELGPDAEPVVIAAFLERMGHAIDARVDQRIAQHAVARGWGPPRDRPRGSAARAWLAVASLVLAIPITAVTSEPGGFSAMVMTMVAWVGIALVNVAFAVGRR